MAGNITKVLKSPKKMSKIWPHTYKKYSSATLDANMELKSEFEDSVGSCLNSKPYLF